MAPPKLRLTPLQLAHAGAFAVVVLFNVLVSLPSKPFGGQTNADVSKAYKTAFTPAGYAFSIWGVIYSLMAGFVVLQALPSRAAWAEKVAGRPAFYPFLVNSFGNSLWLVVFTGEYGKMWVSVSVIFLLVLLPLIVLYLRLDPGVRDYAPISLLHRVARPGAPPSSPPSRRVTWSELVFGQTFVSVYMGWLCVASVANTAIALTPRGAGASGGPGLAGGSPSSWSIGMQIVAASLALAGLATRLDAAFAAPIAWALLAIAAQQQSPDWPGDTSVVVTARVLGWGLVALAGIAAGWRVVLWRRGLTSFAGKGDAGAAGEEEGEGDGGVVAGGKGPKGMMGGGGEVAESMTARLTESAS
jgi:benzodiazapine receptor